MTIKIINDTESPSIDIDKVKAWKEAYTSFYPDELFQILKISIKKQGVKVPVQLVRKKGKWFCVDGLRRLQAVRELIGQNEWVHGNIPAIVNSQNNIEDTYAACAFQQKTLTKSQKAFFGAKWYYEEAKKLADENKKLSDSGIPVNQHFTTSEIVAHRVGLNTPDHVAKAYRLLQFEPWFYEFTYKKGFRFVNTDIKELVALFRDNKARALKIVQKMKEIVENSESDTETKDIYKIANKEVTIAEDEYYNQTDIEAFKNLDIDEITATNEVAPISKDKSTNEQKDNTENSDNINRTRHLKNAQRNLQIDENNGIIMPCSIGLVFRDDTLEETINTIKLALKNCKINFVVIETVDDLTSFISNNDDTATSEQEDNQ